MTPIPLTPLVLTAPLLTVFADVFVAFVSANWKVFLVAAVLVAAYSLCDMVFRAANPVQTWSGQR